MERTLAVAAALAVLEAVRDAIKELREVPSGHLYAALMGRMTLTQYEAVIGQLVTYGAIFKRGHLLVWNPMGPGAIVKLDGEEYTVTEHRGDRVEIRTQVEGLTFQGRSVVPVDDLELVREAGDEAPLKRNELVKLRYPKDAREAAFRYTIDCDIAEGIAVANRVNASRPSHMKMSPWVRLRWVCGGGIPSSVTSLRLEDLQRAES